MSGARLTASALLQTTLTPPQEAVAVALRTSLLLPVDDLLVVGRAFLNPNVSRSGLDRCLRRSGCAPRQADARIAPQGVSGQHHGPVRRCERDDGVQSLEIAVQRQELRRYALGQAPSALIVEDDGVRVGQTREIRQGAEVATRAAMQDDDGLRIGRPFKGRHVKSDLGDLSRWQRAVFGHQGSHRVVTAHRYEEDDDKGDQTGNSA